MQLSEIEILKLIHDFEVHQIELELLNDELKLAKQQAELAVDKYIELYDSAPSGYFTLSNEGVIIELNLSGSQLLGKERPHLINKLFSRYVSNDTKPIFNLFLEKAFSSKHKGTCELIIETEGNLPIYVAMEGIVTEYGEHCLVTGVDITHRKQMEEELRESEERFRHISSTISDISYSCVSNHDGSYSID